MWHRLLITRRVVVNLLSGDAIRGVLLRKRGPLLVVADCEVFPSSGDSAKVDGEIVVERSQVSFIQVLPG
jgi:hypothetical protein